MGKNSGEALVNSEAIFKRLLCIDALIFFDGVIPSLPDFQLKMVNLIELFSKALISEGEDEQLSDRLCNSICCYFDGQISLCLSEPNLSWQRYSLQQYFYGPENIRENLADKITPLLLNEVGKIFSYACKLLTLINASAVSDDKTGVLIKKYLSVNNSSEKVQEEDAKKESTEKVFLPTARRRMASSRLFLELAILTTGLSIVWLFCFIYLMGLY
ncbi:hypothetical protein ACMGGR_20505 [Erwinia sp. BNK-24-b]|uniref:hypothetical protein n=1 Tax=Erwinia TaxID=551 RepID=UPI001FEE10A8|nr:hypothetical protein [Erwinia phyllosphaerae]MBV4367421.1 hypothetical protein [Erwinia phyllosphaerae]